MTEPAQQLSLPLIPEVHSGDRDNVARKTAPPPSVTQRPVTAPLFESAPAALPAPEDLTVAPATLPPNARWRLIDLGEQRIGYALLRSRRRTIGFLITDDGLRVTAPSWVSLTEIDNAVRGKSRWIVTRLQSWRERQRRVATLRTRWEDNGELPYLGQTIVFRTGGDRNFYSGDDAAPAAGDILWLGLPHDAEAARIRDTVQAWLHGRAHLIMGQRLEHFLARTGLHINRWRLSSAQTRWGSCTSQGNIMLNWRLVHFPIAIIDYVIAHELAHLREMNHGPGFWSQVETLLPDYREARDILRRCDPASLPSFG